MERQVDGLIYELVIDSLTDCVRLVPFLFLTYFAVEFMEHRMPLQARRSMFRAGKAGPVIGGLLGIVPQCGFAAAAAGLYAGGIISPGTLLAIFLSSSDEMLPILVSEGMPMGMIIRILAIKAAAAIAAGLLLDAVAGWLGWSRSADAAEHFCEEEHCGCESEGGIWKGALHHTLHITAFLFLFTLVLGFLMEYVDLGRFTQLLGRIPVLEEALAGLIGMIPNCAASVLITQLFLQGMLRTGALFSGLLCGAGAGLLVLYRANRNWKENLLFTAVLYAVGVTAGLLIGTSGMYFL